MTTEGRVVVAVVWAVGMMALTAWSYTDGAVAAMVLLTVLAGCLIARWWVALVPAGAALVLIAGTLGTEPDSDGVTASTWALLIGVIAGATILLLATGVGLRRLWARRAQRLDP